MHRYPGQPKAEGGDVIDVLSDLSILRGVPGHIWSDNGPEFIARFLMRLFAIHGVEKRHIEPGSPWQNAFNERFNGSLRDECERRDVPQPRPRAGADPAVRAALQRASAAQPPGLPDAA